MSDDEGIVGFMALLKMIVVCTTFLITICLGTPDILDAVVAYLMGAAV